MNHSKQPVHNPTYMSSCEKVKKLRQIVNVEKFNTTLLQDKQNRKALAFFKYGQTGASSESLCVTVKISGFCEGLFFEVCTLSRT